MHWGDAREGHVVSENSHMRARAYAVAYAVAYEIAYTAGYIKLHMIFSEFLRKWETTF